MADQLQFITLATPIRPYRWMKVRAMMHAVQHRETAVVFADQILPRPWLRRTVHRLAGMPDEHHPWTAPFEEQVKRLQFLHMARWYVIPRLPREPWLGGTPFNFFVTHFDGGAPDYIGSFVDGFGVYGMSTQWGATPGWPATTATVEGLIDFAMRHLQTHQHEFRAYGELTTGDVRHVLRLDRELRSFHIETRELPPAAWGREFDAFVTRVQGSIGRSAGRIDPDRMAGCQRGAMRGKLWGFLAFSALPRAQAEAVRVALSNLPGSQGTDGVSPFARVTGTHMARLGVMDAYHLERDDADHGTTVPLRQAYVMFAAEFQPPELSPGDEAGPDAARLGNDFATAVTRYLASVHQALGPELTRQIWGRCEGFPSPTRADAEAVRRFVDFFSLSGRGSPPSRVYRPDMEFMDYPVVTTGDIARAAETARRFDAVLLGHRRSPVDVLQRDVRRLIERAEEVHGS